MTRPLLILLAALTALGVRSFAADAPVAPSGPPEFFGRWYVGYGDAKRKSVVGTAQVDKDEKSCTVTLWDPDSQTEFHLTSSEIKREGDTLKIKLEGKSPNSELVEKDREAVQVLKVAKGPSRLTARVGNMVKKSTLKPQGPVDLDHVELELKFDKNDSLTGTWKYHADLDTERDRIGFGRVGNYSETEEDGATVGYQSGPEAWERVKSVIVGVIVLDDQLALKNGQPVFPTPFVADNTSGLHRRLFVYGWDLPKEWADKIQLKGDDATISYSVGALSQALTSSDADKSAMGDGLKRALEGQNPTSQDIIKKMDTMIVTADLNHGVVAGDHSFVLNGSAPGKWTLLFGDGFARLNFAREVGEQKFDVIQEMLAPELGIIEVHTEVPLPLADIPLTISRVRGDKEDQPVKVSAHRVDGKPLLYQTDPFGIYEEDRPALANQADAKGKPVPAFPVLAEDQLKVVLTPPLHVQANPKSTTARIAPPHELGSIWKTALVRAARTHADIDLGQVDLNNLSNKSADYLTNYALLEPLYIAVENTIDQAKGEWRDWKTMSGPDWLVKKSKQFYNNRVAAVKQGAADAVGLSTVSNVPGDRFTKKIPYTVGDHAALLLLRDGFVKMMTEAAARLDQQRSSAGNDRAFRAMIAGQLQDEQSPFSRIRVTPPASYRSTAGKVTAYLTSGEVVNDLPAVMVLRKLGILDAQHGAGLAYSTDVPLRFATNPDFLQEFFPNDPAGAEAWSLQAVHEGFDRYRQAVADSITKAQGVADSDVAGLLDVVSYGFEPVAEQITPHLLKLQDATEPGQYHYQWVPDDQARQVINHIDTFVEAVRAQKDYAKLDTQMVLVMMSVATLPAMWSDAAWAAYLAAAADSTMAGVTVVESVGELKKNWEDQHFALGASLVVGLGRYDEAVASDPGFWSTVANVAGTVGPAVFSGWNAATKFRFASQLDKMEKGGAAAFRELSPSAQKDFMAFAEEARAQRATQGSSSLSKTQERTLAVWDGLAEEAHPGVAGGKPGVEAPKVTSGDEPKKPATPSSEGGDNIAPKLEDETGGTKVADTTPHDSPTGPKAGETETPKQPGETPKVAENNPGEKPPKPQPEPTTPEPNEPKPPKVADNPPPETPGGGKPAEPPVEPGTPKQPGEAPNVADSGGNKPPRGGVDSNEPFGNSPGAEPREPNHLATDHGGKPADVNAPTRKIEPPTIAEKPPVPGAGVNDPTVHLDPTKPPQTPAERKLIEDEIRSRLKQAGVNDVAANGQAYRAANGDVSLDEAKAGAKSYADFPERRPWKPEPGESADKFAKDLDTYMEKADGVKDPAKRAYAINNYMGDQTPQNILDRLPDVGDRPTSPNLPRAPEPHVANPHAPDPAPVRFGADPDAPTVNPDHPAAIAEHSPGEPRGAAADPHGHAVTAENPGAPKESFGHSPGVDPNEPHLATDHGGKPVDVNTPTRNIEPPTVPEKPPAPGAGVNDPTVHLDPTKPPQTPAERKLIEDEIRSRLKQAGVNDAAADFQAYSAAHGDVSLDEAKAGAKSYADFPERRPWKPDPGESADKFAKDLDTYLEKADGVKDPSKRAYAISNYMGEQTPQSIRDRLPDVGDAPTAFNPAKAPVPEPHVPDRPVRFGADPNAPTVNPDHPAALAEHPPAEPGAAHGPAIEAKDSFGHSPGVEPNDPYLATDHGGKPADVNAPTRNVEPPTLPEKPPAPGTGPNDATVHLDPTKPPQTAAEREALRDEIKSRLKQAGVSDFNADAQAHLAVDNGLTLNEAKAGAKDYVDFQNRAKWQPAPGESAQTFANDLDNYLEKTQGAGGKDPAKRANAIANYMGDQTPQNILDRVPEFRDRPTEAIHEPAAPVPEPHVANPHAPDPAPVRFGADPDAPTVNPDHPAALAEHSPAEPAAPRGPPVDPNAHSIHPENPGAPPEAVIDPHAPSIHPENPGAPREAVIDTHAISPENPGAPHEAVIDTSTGPHGISPENPGAPADHPTVIEPGAPRPPAAEKTPPKLEYENPGAPHDAVIDTSTSAHGISPENPGAPPEAVVEPNPRSPKPEPNAGAAKSAPPETPHIEPETPTKTFEPNAGAEKPPAAEPLHEAQFDPNSPTAGAGRPATPETPHETPFDPNAPTHKLESSPAAGKPAAPEAPAPHEGTPGNPAAPEAAAPKPAAPAVDTPVVAREPRYADEAAGFPKKEFPKDGKINPNTVYTTLPEKTPDKPFYYQLEDGKTVLLDKKLGNGANSQAYSLGGAGNEGLIVKFSPATSEKGVDRLVSELMHEEPHLTVDQATADVNNFFRDKITAAAEQVSRETVTEAEKASRLLEEAHIEQARVYSVDPSAKAPYQINQRVTDAEMFKYPPKGEKPVATGAATWTPAHDKAVVKLYEKLADSGLVAEDLHVENLYFKKQADGSYIAGILDHDHITTWEEAKQTPWFKAMQENPGDNGILGTSRGGRPYQNPTEFMAEMLEHKRWVSRPQPGAEIKGTMMDVNALKGSTLEKYLKPSPVKPTGWIPTPAPRRGQLVSWPGAPALAA